jgi:hypothetical protein
MSQFGSPLKLCPSSPKKSRNEVEWDKWIICQVSTPELLIKMRNVSKNSLIEATEGRRDGVIFRVVHSVSDIDNLRSDDTSMLVFRRALVLTSSREDVTVDKVMSFPIGPIPTSLFHDDGSMWKTCKADLAHQLEAQATSTPLLGLFDKSSSVLIRWHGSPSIAECSEVQNFW